MGYFKYIYRENLPHRAKAVYMYLQDRADAEGKCFPSIGTIARELNLSRRIATVWVVISMAIAIADLVQAGLLRKEQRWRENGGRSSLLYTIRCRPPPGTDSIEGRG